MVWQLWQQSQSLRCRPSDLLGIRGSVRRFYFDRGIHKFGMRVENALSAAEASVRGKGKSGKSNQIMVNNARQQAMDKILKIDPLIAKKRYRDPALNMKPKEDPGESRGHSTNEDVEVGVGFLG